ncbi:winged helix DNA-binding protein [Bradyrhizobium sp. 14AA]
MTRRSQTTTSKAIVKMQESDPGHKKQPPHLASNEHEASITEFEQALICAAEAFYRWGGALLGAEGRESNLNGQDCVILQQLVAANGPRRISDLARFANRDDLSNIQYSIKKLVTAGLVQKAEATSFRDAAYEVTAKAEPVVSRFIEARRQLLMDPTAALPGLREQMANATQSLGLLTGLYDHGARVLSRRN